MEIVSFEIAKKLKEKGFKEKCLAYYDVNDNVGLLYNTQYTGDMLPCQYTDLLQSHNTDATVTQPDDSEYCVDAPTISQVLKWLREEKDVVVSVNPYYGKFVNVHWWWDIRTPVYKVEICNNIKQEGFDSYELAAIAGIEYVIDNLI